MSGDGRRTAVSSSLFVGVRASTGNGGHTLDFGNRLGVRNQHCQPHKKKSARETTHQIPPSLRPSSRSRAPSRCKPLALPW